MKPLMVNRLVNVIRSNRGPNGIGFQLAQPRLYRHGGDV
jgi:hypothetical protein